MENINGSIKADIRELLKQRKEYYLEHIKAYHQIEEKVKASNDIILKLDVNNWYHIISEFCYLYGIIGIFLDNMVNYGVPLNKESEEKLERLDKETKYLREEGMKWVFQDIKQLWSEIECKENINGDNND